MPPAPRLPLGRDLKNGDMRSKQQAVLSCRLRTGLTIEKSMKGRYILRGQQLRLEDCIRARGKSDSLTLKTGIGF